MHFLFRTLENKLIEKKKKKNPIYHGKSGKVYGIYSGKFIVRCQKIKGKSGGDNCIVPSWKTRFTLLHIWDGRRSYSHRPTTLLFQCVHSHFFNESSTEGMYCGKSGKVSDVRLNAFTLCS